MTCTCEPNYGHTCRICEAEQRLHPVTRFDLVTNYRCGGSIEEMEPADEGRWVRYEDVLAALSEPPCRVHVAPSREQQPTGYVHCVKCGMRLGFRGRFY